MQKKKTTSEGDSGDDDNLSDEIDRWAGKEREEWNENEEAKWSGRMNGRMPDLELRHDRQRKTERSGRRAGGRPRPGRTGGMDEVRRRRRRRRR